MAPPAHDPMAPPDEPLRASAGLALRESACRCARADEATSCRPYHGLWQILRLLGIGKTLSGQSAAYLAALDDWARAWRDRAPGRPPRVLISGCADYSALAHVRHALRPHGLAADVVALDLCQTPLWLNRWYAAREGVDVRTVCADVLEWTGDETFDLILTSSFLGYFDAATRPRLFARYAALLEPGGRLVFANRLRDGSEMQATGFSDGAAHALAEQVARRIDELAGVCELGADEARMLARAYATRFRSFPLNGDASVRPLARQAGLAVADARRIETAPLQAAVAGPSVGDGAPYLFCVLVKDAAR